MPEPHKPTCARLIREQAQAFGQTEQEIARKIHEHCGVSLLRARRLARGWTLEQVVVELRLICTQVWNCQPSLSHQRVSQWESGSDIPSPRYLDALCRLYRTRPDLLGFGHDYSETPSGEPSGHLASAPVDRRSLHRAEGSTRSIAATSQNDDGEDEMKRRQLLRALAAGGMVMTAPLFEALRVERTLADTLLDTQSVSAATVDDWEIVARDYGARQLTTPLYTFLAEAMCDFAKLRAVLAQRQPLEFQRRLYRVMAQLAGLIATSVNAAGDLRETHSWFHTARLAAEETGDRALRAWVTAYEGMSYLWYGRRVERAVELSQTARALAGGQPNAAGALATAIEARAHARTGDRTKALAAIRRSEAIFDRLQPWETEENVLGFYEQLFRFYQSNVLTYIGETKAALAPQQRALELSPPEMEIDPVLIRLDRATCLVHEGEVAEGCHSASRALLSLSPEARRGTPTTRAHELVKMIPSGANRIGAVRDLREILQGALMPPSLAGSVRGTA